MRVNDVFQVVPSQINYVIKTRFARRSPRLYRQQESALAVAISGLVD